MKKIIYSPGTCFLLCFIFFAACSPEEKPEPVPQEQTTLLRLNLPETYFPDYADVDYTGAIYLSNSVGDLLAGGELENGMQAEFGQIIDLTRETFDLTLIRKVEYAGETSFRIHTYLNVDPYDLSFQNPLVKPRLDKASVRIMDTGSPIEHFIYNRPSYTGEVSENEAVFDISLNEETDHLFFTVKKRTEDFRRYVLLKNITSSTNETLDFSKLPAFNNLITLSFPENDFLFASIKGAENAEPNNFYAGIDEIRAVDGRTSYGFAVPDGLFGRYNLLLELRKGTKQYRLEEKTNSIDQHYEFPQWDLHLASRDSRYVFTSSAATDYFSVNFRYIPAEKPYDVVWTIYGEKTAESTFALPKIEAYIYNFFPDFKVENLNAYSASLIRLDGIHGYKDFIMSREDHYSSEKKAIMKSDQFTLSF